MNNSELRNKIRQALLENGTSKAFSAVAIESVKANPLFAEMLEDRQKEEVEGIAKQIETTLKGKDYSDIELHPAVIASAINWTKLHGGLGAWNPPKPIVLPASFAVFTELEGFELKGGTIKGHDVLTCTDWKNYGIDLDTQRQIAKACIEGKKVAQYTELELFTVTIPNKQHPEKTKTATIKLPASVSIYTSRK